LINTIDISVIRIKGTAERRRAIWTENQTNPRGKQKNHPGEKRQGSIDESSSKKRGENHCICKEKKPKQKEVRKPAIVQAGRKV
jgi:hypothetical protein